MTLISLFAGVGGFDLGFERAGFRPVGMCEIDPHARSVLDKHWPDVPKHDDITTLTGMRFGPADVITFGSPCQDLSVAGKRAGLDGERSGLFLEAVRFIREMLEETDGQYPRVAVWENVPGSFSSQGGRDFAAVLESLVGGEVRHPPDGWAYAGVAFGPLGSAEWRVLDSQHFGVAQRRRRVFLVYRPGGERAGEVLLEPRGVRGDSAPRRAPGEGITGALTGGAGSSSAGNVDDNRAQAGFVVPVVADTLTVGANQTYGFPGEAVPVETAPTVLGISQELDAEEELVGTLKMGSPSGGGTQAMVALPIAPTVTASWGHNGYSSPRGDGTDPIVPVAFKVRGGKEGGGKGYLGSVDQALTLSTVQEQFLAEPLAFALRGREDGATPEVSGDRTNALRGAGGGSSRDYVAYSEPLEAPTNDRVRHHANASETHSRTLLRSLRETLGAQAFEEWAIGVATALQSPPVLRPRVHEGRLPFAPEGHGSNEIAREIPGAATDTAGAVRAVWDAQCSRRASQGRRPLEQLPRELGAYLSLLSLEGTQPEAVLHDLWETGQGLRVLRQALSAVQEVGRPAHGETEPTHAGHPDRGIAERAALGANEGGDASRGEPRTAYAVRRLTPRCFRECERLQGFPDDWTRYAADGTEIADTHRYRMMGNAVSVPVAEWIARRLKEALS